MQIVILFLHYEDLSNKGMHGLGWVKLRKFFDPTHHGGSKKIQPNSTYHISSTQPNPYGSGWTNFFYYY